MTIFAVLLRNIPLVMMIYLSTLVSYSRQDSGSQGFIGPHLDRDEVVVC